MVSTDVKWLKGDAVASHMMACPEKTDARFWREMTDN